MKRRTRLAWALLALSLPAFAAETGDVDGDGRLTLADVRHAARGIFPAPGSVDAFLHEDPCGTTLYRDLEGIIYTETLSRGVDGALPHWVLPFSALDRAPPPPVDARVGIRIEDVSAPGGGNDQAELLVTLVSYAPVVAFSLVLDSDSGILRIPFREKTWYRNYWDQGFSCCGGWEHDQGDLKVDVFAPPFLITGGKYVVSYGLFSRGGNPPSCPANIRSSSACVFPGAHLPESTPSASSPPRRCCWRAVKSFRLPSSTTAS